MQRHVASAAIRNISLRLQDVGFGERAALGRDFDIALLQHDEAQQRGGFHDGQQIVDFESQVVRQVVDLFAAVVIAQHFEQAGDAARTGVRQHLILVRHLGEPAAAAIRAAASASPGWVSTR